MNPENKILKLLAKHEQWRLNECINLIPSENVSSPQVRNLLASDLGHRYTLFVNTILHGVPIENAYGGTKYTDMIESEAEKITNKVFNSKFCTLKPLSGHVAAVIMLSALCKSNDRILAIHADHGGYDGYLQEYIPNILGLKSDYLPFVTDDWNLNSIECSKAIKQLKPRLVVLGASFILFPYDIKPIREACSEVGAYLGYDASHVLGLIAGGEFQKPLVDGVDIVSGSTHKTLFGPQGGLILTNNDEVYERITNRLAWYTIDNPHQNRIAALGQTMFEFEMFGKNYAVQTIKNSKILARTLSAHGIPVRFGHKDYSESHQILLDIDIIKSEMGYDSKELLQLMESNNIIFDAIGRLGTNEMTRRGCCEKEMVEIAGFIKGVLLDNDKTVKSQIQKFLKNCKLKYCFNY